MRRGFTLIELIIALALMVVMMLGVNYIFSSVGKVTGSVSTLSQMTRDAQAAQAVMAQDMAGIVTDNPPFLIIKSQVVQAFKTKLDQLGQPYIPNTTTQYPPLVETDSSGGTFTQANTFYDDRNHRTDILKFFSRGTFRRQTGNDGVYVDDLGSSQAQISYGHLKLYNGNGTLTVATNFPAPGDAPTVPTPNPNNLYATQWKVGRNVLLTTTPTYTTFDATGKPLPPGVIRDNENQPQNFYEHSDTAKSSLAAGVTANDANNSLVQSSRYDLVSGGIDDQVRQIKYLSSLSPTWYDNFNFTYRFWGNPFMVKPLDSAGVSQTTPIFLSGCTQFIVEYAGDYLNQNPADGTILNTCGYMNGASYVDTPIPQPPPLPPIPSTDGVQDFIFDPVTGGRAIRWYGFPREISGDGKILLNDVIPLRDIIKTRYASATNAPMERSIPTPAAAGDYTTGIASGGPQNYEVVWGPQGTYGAGVPSPNPPSMIRIIYTLDDPDGRLADGQTFEYVFKLK